MCENTILKILSVQNASLLLQTAHFRDAFALKKRCLSFILDRFGEVIATEVRRKWVLTSSAKCQVLTVANSTV